MKTQKQKDDAWRRYEEKVKQLGYDDNYGCDQPSVIKQRIQPWSHSRNNKIYYKGDDHQTLWGMDLSNEELLDKIYGEKKHDRA